MNQMSKANGALTCARYAFAPNYYHYCGPDTTGVFGDYVEESYADGKLSEYITQFETLYPYLASIAKANNIADPLNKQVVEAYWVGNSLLNKVNPQHTFEALTEGQHLKKRLDKQSMRWLLPKIDQRAKLHHSFHVFNIFTRTGHRTVAHTVETMDQCRIGWGQVYEISTIVKVRSQRLIYNKGRLEFQESDREVVNPVAGLSLQAGDWVSYHWGYVCDKITMTQVDCLKKLTNHHLKLANLTL